MTHPYSSQPQGHNSSFGSDSSYGQGFSYPQQGHTGGYPEPQPAPFDGENATQSWQSPQYPQAQPGELQAAGLAPSGQRRRAGKGVGPVALVALMLGSAVIGASSALITQGALQSAPSSNMLEQPAASTVAAAPAGSVEEVAQRVLPSVVSITTVTRNGVATGSGSILSADGLVLTNNHVVAGAENGGRLQVQLADGTRHPAEFVAGDASTDIAVIRIEGVNSLRPISLGNSSQVQVGQAVVAVGSPLGLSSTVTQGIVSAKNRPVSAAGENGEASVIDAIQTDAAINPGNSGGALVDMAGNLIGVPSVIASMQQGEAQAGSIGLGFAIPIDQARRIAEDLIETGRARMPIIGAQIDPRPTVAGALVRDITAGGPADIAGLRRGDVITKVDDRSLDNGTALIATIRSHRIGDSVTLTVTDEDGENERQVDVTLVEAP